MGGVNVHADVRQKDFRADENQNDSQRGFEVDEAVDGGGQEKIERPQAENGKDVAGVNDEYVLSNQENCRNAVNGKNDVHRFDNQQGEEQRRDKMPSVAVNKEMFVMQPFGYAEPFSDELVEFGFGQRNVVFLFGNHFDARIKQEEGKDIENPMKSTDQLGADANHPRA